MAFFVGVEAGLELGAGNMLYGGSLAAITDFMSDPDIKPFLEGVIGGPVSKLDAVELFCSLDPPTPVTGQLVTYPVIGGAGTVYLLNFDTGVPFTSVYVPEPVTFVLLGLGGLFLRRRK
jgi:hypothetical protein